MDSLASAPDTSGELAEIVGLLRLEQLEVNMFRGRAVSDEPRRLYGGQVAAQALAAAGYTAAGTRAHSLHAYFLRPGDSSAPVVFDVEPLQDGRTFRRRRVTAIQRGEAILCLESSFTTDGTGTTDYPPPPEVPDPEDCPRYDHAGRAPAGRVSPWTLFEARVAAGTGQPPGRSSGIPSDGIRPSAADMWFRLRAVAESEGIAGEAIITYLSDLTLAWSASRPSARHPRGRPEITGMTSLDHSVWFHNPADLSDWLLYAKVAPVTGPVRGLTAGQIFDRRGVLVASVAQECLAHSRGPGQSS
ncbi:MAG: thioesterase family protein [Nocardiopsaceae bacterium]|nr:thioesterase family protein [Nocardiopsaceae bacterium]